MEASSCGVGIIGHGVFWPGACLTRIRGAMTEKSLPYRAYLSSRVASRKQARDLTLGCPRPSNHNPGSTLVGSLLQVEQASPFSCGSGDVHSCFMAGHKELEPHASIL